MASTSSKLSPKGNMILGIFFVVLAVIFAGIGAILMQSAREQASWPTVQGVASNINKRVEQHRSNNTYVTDTYYDYTLSYTVDGRDYSSKTTSNEEITENQKIRVHYNPVDPSENSVESQDGIGSWIMYGLAALELIGGIVFIVIARRSGKLKTSL